MHMKKSATLLLVFALLSFSAFAQKDEDGAFPKGSLAINAGIGLGDVYWGTGYGTGFPVAPTLSIDYALTNKIGIGNIGVGGVVSYTSTKYSDGVGDDYKFSGILVGLRGTYHFILPIDKLDPYAGVIVGYVISNSSLPGDYVAGYGPDGKASGVQPGAFVGAHYFFTPMFGVHAELGYNVFSVLNLGITLKF